MKRALIYLLLHLLCWRRPATGRATGGYLCLSCAELDAVAPRARCAACISVAEMTGIEQMRQLDAWESQLRTEAAS